MDRVTDPGGVEPDPDLTVKQTGSGSGSAPQETIRIWIRPHNNLSKTFLFHN